MSAPNLAKYIKPDPSEKDMVTTSVYIEGKQKAFLKKKRLCLSAIARDAVDRLMEEETKK
jgi:hypothetical protein